MLSRFYSLNIDEQTLIPQRRFPGYLLEARKRKKLFSYDTMRRLYIRRIFRIYNKIILRYRRVCTSLKFHFFSHTFLGRIL